MGYSTRSKARGSQPAAPAARTAPARAAASRAAPSAPSRAARAPPRAAAHQPALPVMEDSGIEKPKGRRGRLAAAAAAAARAVKAAARGAAAATVTAAAAHDDNKNNNSNDDDDDAITPAQPAASSSERKTRTVESKKTSFPVITRRKEAAASRASARASAAKPAAASTAAPPPPAEPEPAPGPPSKGKAPRAKESDADNLFPDVPVQDESGNTVQSREAVAGSSHAIVFLYPKANTPGCTKQACGFRDNYAQLRAAGFSVFGLSYDSPKSQLNWKNKNNFPYSLLCDTLGGGLIAALGASKPPKSIKRSHFVVAKGGAILDTHITIAPGDSVSKAVAFALAHKVDALADPKESTAPPAEPSADAEVTGEGSSEKASTVPPVPAAADAPAEHTGPPPPEEKTAESGDPEKPDGSASIKKPTTQPEVTTETDIAPSKTDDQPAPLSTDIPDETIVDVAPEVAANGSTTDPKASAAAVGSMHEKASPLTTGAHDMQTHASSDQEHKMDTAKQTEVVAPEVSKGAEDKEDVPMDKPIEAEEQHEGQDVVMTDKPGDVAPSSDVNRPDAAKVTTV